MINERFMNKLIKFNIKRLQIYMILKNNQFAVFRIFLIIIDLTVFISLPSFHILRLGIYSRGTVFCKNSINAQNIYSAVYSVGII